MILIYSIEVIDRKNEDEEYQCTYYRVDGEKPNGGYYYQVDGSKILPKSIYRANAIIILED